MARKFCYTHKKKWEIKKLERARAEKVISQIHSQIAPQQNIENITIWQSYLSHPLLLLQAIPVSTKSSLSSVLTLEQLHSDLFHTHGMIRQNLSPPCSKFRCARLALNYQYMHSHLLWHKQSPLVVIALGM